MPGMPAVQAPVPAPVQAAPPAPVRDAPVPAQNQWSKGRPRTEEPPKPVEKPQMSSWQDTSPQADISAQVQATATASIDSLLGGSGSTAPSSSAMASSSVTNGATSGSGSAATSAAMNQSSYLSDNSGLSSAFAGVSLENYGAGKSAHKPAETAPQQAQATAAFNNAYMANTSTAGSVPQQQYQQPAQQAQRSAPPPPQAPEQQASQAQPVQSVQAQTAQQQQQQPAQQPGAENDMYKNMYGTDTMQQMYMQMGGAAGKGMQGGQNMQGMNMQDQMTPQL